MTAANLSVVGPTTTNGPRVVVRDLKICRAGSKSSIVEDVSFDIGNGEVLGVVGESGSGKTTTGLALLGYARRGLEIASGSIVIDGLDILSLSPEKLRAARGRVAAYVPQDPASALNPAMRVGTQIRETICAHEACLQSGETIDGRVSELLDQVGIPAAAARAYPHQLSGGQQQRIGIAIALAARPALIIFDEPTTGLDVTTQRKFLDLVRDLTESTGISSLYVSHDLPVVSELAHRTAVMKSGRLVEIGPSATIFGRPSHDYTKKLVASAPSVDRMPTDPAELQLSTSDVTLKCAHVRAWYGSHDVLADVNVTVRRGACVAVVGESGSGKTTFARSLIGLHHDWSGDVELDGVRLRAKAKARSREERRRFQYIFQSPYNSLNPRRTVGDIVNEPLEFFTNLDRRARLAKISAAFDQVSLPQSYLNRYPGQLSGGERQRVSLARALVVDPDVLLCDEITSALDVSVQAIILDQLRELQAARNVSLLFITHDMAVVRAVAQEVVVLEKGVIVEQGAVDDVLDNPQHEYTRRLLADVPRLRTGRESAPAGG